MSILKRSGRDVQLAQVVAMLPATKSNHSDVFAHLSDLCTRFHHWLHQDEFGPSRGEQTTALRELTKLVAKLCQLLKSGTIRSRTRLDAALRHGTDAVSPPLMAFAVTASEVKSALQPVRASDREVAWFSRLERRAGQLTMRLHELDDATDAQITETAWCRNFELSQSMAVAEFGLPEAEGWLLGYRNVLDETLQKLMARRGAQERSSLKLLVEELCHLWRDETDLPVAAHGIVKNEYTSRAQTDAGRFVTAAVEAMLPDKPWFDEPAKFAHSVRTQTFLPDGHGNARQTRRAGQILVIMRDFVARRSRPAKMQLRTR